MRLSHKYLASSTRFMCVSHIEITKHNYIPLIRRELCVLKKKELKFCGSGSSDEGNVYFDKITIVFEITMYLLAYRYHVLK